MFELTDTQLNYLLTITDCGQPPAIANGEIDSPAGTLYGHTVIYTCNTGYTLSGDNTRTCQSSGNWRPAQPTCQITGRLTTVR